MKIALVVPRYGLEVEGGIELHCRWVGEHLSKYFQVHVITTCALDYMRWENHYPPGTESLNGVIVHRFSVDAPRDIRRFDRLSQTLFAEPHHHFQEIEWGRQQGPLSSSLLEFIKESRGSYDLFIFFSYLYFTTLFGLPLVPWKSLLVPAAHDEPPIYLDLFVPIFHLPRFIIYSTEAERRFVQGRFHNEHVPSAVVGTGINLPAQAQGERFRRKYGIGEEFILYLGRIDRSKGCDELFDFFLRYKDETEERLRLVLIGKAAMSVPEDADIIPLGFLSEEDKFDGLKATSLLVAPSEFESLSMSSLEAWLMETPVLANGRCEVLRENCQQSNGGLYYTSYEEFSLCLRLLLRNDPLRRRLGQRGRIWAEEKYSWDAVETQYLQIIEGLS